MTEASTKTERALRKDGGALDGGGGGGDDVAQNMGSNAYRRKTNILLQYLSMR